MKGTKSPLISHFYVRTVMPTEGTYMSVLFYERHTLVPQRQLVKCKCSLHVVQEMGWHETPDLFPPQVWGECWCGGWLRMHGISIIHITDNSNTHMHKHPDTQSDNMRLCTLCIVYETRFGESQSVSDETRDGILPPQVDGVDKPADSSTPGPPTEPNDPLTLWYEEVRKYSPLPPGSPARNHTLSSLQLSPSWIAHRSTDIYRRMYIWRDTYIHMPATHFSSGLACMLHTRMYVPTYIWRDINIWILVHMYEEITPGQIHLQHTVSVDQTCMLHR